MPWKHFFQRVIHDSTLIGNRWGGGLKITQATLLFEAICTHLEEDALSSSKIEISLLYSRLVNKITSQFQRLYSCFGGRAIQ